MTDMDMALMPQRAAVRILGAPIEHTVLGGGSSLVTQSAEVRVTIIGQEPIAREVPKNSDTSGDVNRSSADSSL